MIRILLWIIRALAILLLVRMILAPFLTRRRNPQASPGPRGSGSAPERQGGDLVRDPNCGTYVPKSRAIVIGSGDAARYFCSEKCRDEYAKR